MIHSYRDLRVWTLGMYLVEQVYRVTQTFPREEIYGLTSQMRRAAVSIPSNIAEGHTREHSREYLHHISIAQASLAELETHLEIALRLGFLQPDHAAPIVETFASLGRQLFALRNSLNRRIVSEDSADLYMLTDFESGQPDPIVQENGGHEATSIQ